MSKSSVNISIYIRYVAEREYVKWHLRAIIHVKVTVRFHKFHKLVPHDKRKPTSPCLPLSKDRPGSDIQLTAWKQYQNIKKRWLVLMGWSSRGYNIFAGLLFLKLKAGIVCIICVRLLSLNFSLPYNNWNNGKEKQ